MSAVPFASVVTPDSVVFTAPNGKTHTVSSDHTSFDEIKELVRNIGLINIQKKFGNEKADPTQFIERLLVLVQPAVTIDQQGQGKVKVINGVVYYDGVPVHSVLSERILWGLREEFEMTPYVMFLENLMRNPSKRAVDELFTFVERHKMGITEDGHILGYKRVKEDFKDIYSGTIDNSPGQIISMPRNQVNDDPNQTCSSGLHFCSQSYLPSYGKTDGNKIVIVKVDPADVVSVPVDYNAAKVRCCRYEVLSEYEGSDKDDLLATKAVFHDSEFRSGNQIDDTAFVDFEVGDMVLCVDDSGLGQTDISAGNTYRVDNIKEGRIWIGVDQGIGRFYDQTRFVIASSYEDFGSSDAPEDDAYNDDEVNQDFSDYDRAYDAGFAKALEENDPDATMTCPEDSIVYQAGFSVGWHDAMQNLRSQQTAISEPIPEPITETVIESSELSESYGEPQTILVEDFIEEVHEVRDLAPSSDNDGFEPATWVEPSVEPFRSVEVEEVHEDTPKDWIEAVESTESVEQEETIMAVPFALPEVKIPTVSPMHDPFVSDTVNIQFDPLSGGFKIAR